MLIADEIQCGMGRTGKFFAYQNFDVKPDIVASAKALGCGVSVGAFILSERVAKHSLEASEHGSTYGGNPFACAAVNAVFEIFEKEKVLENVRSLTPFFEKVLDELVARFKFIKKRSGLGFMQGLSLDKSVNASEVIAKARENKLLILPCGANDLRFLPPFVLEKKHLEEFFKKLEITFKNFIK